MAKKYKYIPERYPHTHYEISPEWFGEYLAILRNWSMTLTHLGAKFAEKEAGDCQEIYEEIHKICDTLDDWVSKLTAAWQAVRVGEAAFQEQTLALATQLELLTESLTTIINNLYPAVQALVKALQDALDALSKKIDDVRDDLQKQIDDLDQKIDDVREDLQAQINNINQAITNINNTIGDIQNDISKLYQYINDIYSILESLISGGETTATELVRGTDYTLSYYNDFGDYSAGPPTVTLYEQVLSTPSSTFHSNRVHFSSTSSGGVTLGEVFEPDVESKFQFRHGDDLATATYSYIFQLNFLRTIGNWISGSQTGSEIWNMNPRSARARWGVQCSPHWMLGGVLVCADTIGDGFNAQYYNSYERELTPTILNMNFDLYFSYTES